MDTQKVITHVRQNFQEPEAFIPLHVPRFEGNERKYVLDCLDSTYVSSVGEYVNRFEAETAAYTGSNHAIVTVNGTAALHMALILAGVKSGDLVITQALSFVATTNAISYTGAQPVFLDVDKHTMGLSPAAVQQFLDEQCDGNIHKATGKRIAAIVPMHTFGHPCDMEGLMALSRKHYIPLIEDAAESLGSFYKGKHTGTLGQSGTLSYNGNKTITTGGGGMILIQDEELALRAKHLTTQSKVPHRWEYVHDNTGYNYRMPNINAALGVAQLEQLPMYLDKKRALAMSYKQLLSDSNIRFMDEPDGCKSNFWLVAIALQDRAARDKFLQETNDAGVMTRPIWALLNSLPMYTGAIQDDLTVSRWLEDRIVNLPSSVIL